MNEMYDMSIVTHNFGVIGILIVVLINLVFLFSATDVRKYKRAMSLFTPIGSLAIGTVIFTGVVMMAAKHLEFSVENITMIIFAVSIIFLEVSRARTLKRLSVLQENALADFKVFATRVLLLEVLITLLMSAWMWL
ncbi:MAG: hypothetical protein FP820_09725 [Sulfurimonas sp.]|nr:hypothetical protein [Sulfurimonas sp.]MBU1217087.1 hypothetical protein [bacterium]MBU1435354.1 hypothetical protein [bacterium]MBU1502335.1 hypothetical protein [bacterium]MBU3939561.1 hypothetical protein [bacterium]